MATIGAIAFKRASATERLTKALGEIGKPFEIDPPKLPTQGHDPAFVHAAQIETLADWAERLAAALQPVEQESVYASMTKAELVKELEAREIDLESIEGTGANGNVLVEDLRAALRADDEANLKTPPAGD